MAVQVEMDGGWVVDLDERGFFAQKGERTVILKTDDVSIEASLELISVMGKEIQVNPDTGEFNISQQ